MNSAFCIFFIHLLTFYEFNKKFFESFKIICHFNILLLSVFLTSAICVCILVEKKQKQELKKIF